MRYPIREPSMPFIPILILVVGILLTTALIASYEPKEKLNEISKNLLERSEKLF